MTLKACEWAASPAWFSALQVKFALCSGLRLSILSTDSKFPICATETPPCSPGLRSLPSLNQDRVSGRSPSTTEQSMETRWPSRRDSPTVNLFSVGGTGTNLTLFTTHGTYSRKNTVIRVCVRILRMGKGIFPLFGVTLGCCVTRLVRGRGVATARDAENRAEQIQLPEGRKRGEKQHESVCFGKMHSWVSFSFLLINPSFTFRGRNRVSGPNNPSTSCVGAPLCFCRWEMK